MDLRYSTGRINRTRKPLPRQILIAVTALAIAVLPGCAWFPHRKSSPLVGSWTNRTGMVWTIKADGTFDVDVNRDGKGDAWGTYQIDGETITIRSTGGVMPKDCTGDGVYYFKRSGPELIFTVVNDRCKLRKTNLLLGWHRQR